MRVNSNVSSGRVVAALGVFGVAAALLGGCGSSSVSQSDEAKNAKNFIEQKLTDLPPVKSMDCPSGVDTKAGTTFACTATLENGQKVTLPLSVTSSSGGHGTMGTDASVIDNAYATDLIYQHATAPVKSVDCPTGVKAKPGVTIQCKVNLANGENDLVTVKVVAIDPKHGAQQLAIVGVHTA
jgi:NAD(P)H-hydrate repair Nnr-like enzyme with NAD(P)H-hydrate epimerase domain